MNIELKNKLMNLCSDTLISDLQKLVSDERKLKAEILHYLWVVQQKRIFAELGFSSLFEFCVKHLGYTEAESQRRISAMRLLGEIPAIEEKISLGKLSLSSLAMAQSLFRAEAKTNQSFSKEQKMEVLQALENKTVRECEKEILKFSNTPIKPQEKVRPISQDQVQISFSAPNEFIEKLEKLKALRSYSNSKTSTLDILGDLLDKAIQKEDPALQTSRRNVSVAREVKETQSVSVHTIRLLWQKHNSKCSFVDPKNGRKCNSRHFLEVEHIKPKAKGGNNHEENLKLYCRSHNQLTAIQQFGFEHMDKFINSSI